MELPDRQRPLVLTSSAGVPLLLEAAAVAETHACCLRNVDAQVRHLLNESESDVALIAAGTRGQSRREDSIGCARIASQLLAGGLRPDQRASALARQRGAASTADCGAGRSGSWLRESGRLFDLEFVLTHVDDLDAVYPVRGGELVSQPVSSPAPTPGAVSAGHSLALEPV
jgi:phosphosulfolactate phosphohydrolase-like enzyme